MPPKASSAIAERLAPGFAALSSTRSRAAAVMYAKARQRTAEEGPKPAPNVLTGRAMMPAPTAPPAISATAPSSRPPAPGTAPAAPAAPAASQRRETARTRVGGRSRGCQNRATD